MGDDTPGTRNFVPLCLDDRCERRARGTAQAMPDARARTKAPERSMAALPARRHSVQRKGKALCVSDVVLRA
jgi:hypothetical protein